MFNFFHRGLIRKIERLYAELDAAKEQMQMVVAEAEKLQKRAFLLDIGTIEGGRMVQFTFARAGEIHTVEVMRLLSDNIGQWKKDLVE